MLHQHWHCPTRYRIAWEAGACKLRLPFNARNYVLGAYRAARELKHLPAQQGRQGADLYGRMASAESSTLEASVWTSPGLRFLLYPLLRLYSLYQAYLRAAFYGTLEYKPKSYPATAPRGHACSGSARWSGQGAASVACCAETRRCMRKPEFLEDCTTVHVQPRQGPLLGQ